MYIVWWSSGGENPEGKIQHKQYQKIFKIKSILILYSYDFNALNYQHSHFGISRNEYIRTIFNDIFLSTSKLTLFSIEKGWINTDRWNKYMFHFVIITLIDKDIDFYFW